MTVATIEAFKQEPLLFGYFSKRCLRLTVCSQLHTVNAALLTMQKSQVTSKALEIETLFL